MNRRIALALVALVALVATITASVAMASSHKKSAVIPVTVRMFDYGFKLSRTSVPKGSTVRFTVLNTGKTVHNFDLQGYKSTPISGPKSKKIMTVVLKKAGKIQYVCDVPRHAELGMTGTFTVK